MERIRLAALAKINYALEVRGVRRDGYHEISTVMQSISLADEVEVEHAAGTGIELTVEPEGVEVGPPEKNAVCRAWSLLCEAVGHDLPARVRLHKRVPAGAGLGGASTDAAAVLSGLNELFGLGLDAEELGEVGVRVGADVPFCISGGTALAEGVGERIVPLPAPPSHHLLLAKPDRGADTGLIYRVHDENPPEESESYVELVAAALRGGDLRGLARSAGNELAPATAKLAPEVEEHERCLLKSGALGTAMSGSGTAVYGIFETEDVASAAEKRLRAPFTGVYRPIHRGIEALA